MPDTRALKAKLLLIADTIERNISFVDKKVQAAFSQLIAQVFDSLKFVTLQKQELDTMLTRKHSEMVQQKYGESFELTHRRVNVSWSDEFTQYTRVIQVDLNNIMTCLTSALNISSVSMTDAYFVNTTTKQMSTACTRVMEDWVLDFENGFTIDDEVVWKYYYSLLSYLFEIGYLDSHGDNSWRCVWTFDKLKKIFQKQFQTHIRMEVQADLDRICLDIVNAVRKKLVPEPELVPEPQLVPQAKNSICIGSKRSRKEDEECNKKHAQLARKWRKLTIALLRSLWE